MIDGVRFVWPDSTAELHAWWRRRGPRNPGEADFDDEEWYLEGRLKGGRFDLAECSRLVADVQDAFRACSGTQPLWYLDWQHDEALFWPDRGDLTWDELFGHGETVGFLAQDFSWGVISIDWDGKGTWFAMFGEPLVARILGKGPTAPRTLGPFFLRVARSPFLQ